MPGVFPADEEARRALQLTSPTSDPASKGVCVVHQFESASSFVRPCFFVYKESPLSKLRTESRTEKLQKITQSDAQVEVALLGSLRILARLQELRKLKDLASRPKDGFGIETRAAPGV